MKSKTVSRIVHWTAKTELALYRLVPVLIWSESNDKHYSRITSAHTQEHKARPDSLRKGMWASGCPDPTRGWSETESLRPMMYQGTSQPTDYMKARLTPSTSPKKTFAWRQQKNNPPGISEHRHASSSSPYPRKDQLDAIMQEFPTLWHTQWKWEFRDLI